MINALEILTLRSNRDRRVNTAQCTQDSSVFLEQLHVAVAASRTYKLLCQGNKLVRSYQQ